MCLLKHRWIYFDWRKDEKAYKRLCSKCGLTQREAVVTRHPVFGTSEYSWRAFIPSEEDLKEFEPTESEILKLPQPIFTPGELEHLWIVENPYYKGHYQVVQKLPHQEPKVVFSPPQCFAVRQLSLQKCQSFLSQKLKRSSQCH